VDSLKFLVPVRQATPHSEMGGPSAGSALYTFLPIALQGSGHESPALAAETPSDLSPAIELTKIAMAVAISLPANQSVSISPQQQTCRLDANIAGMCSSTLQVLPKLASGSRQSLPHAPSRT
jgi:hypothetical protein